MLRFIVNWYLGKERAMEFAVPSIRKNFPKLSGLKIKYEIFVSLQIKYIMDCDIFPMTT